MLRMIDENLIKLDNFVPAAVDLDLQFEHQPAPMPDGYIRYSDIGVAYKVYEEYDTWIEAMRKCEQDDAQLALIDSFEKIRHVTSQRRTPGSTYVGIIRMLDDTIWMGVATGEFVFSNISSSDLECIEKIIRSFNARRTNLGKYLYQHRNYLTNGTQIGIRF